jgi:cellulose synthase/poly-beta-1,6-N-acetylglucosamine synthase-like glycosyltransferase
MNQQFAVWLSEGLLLLFLIAAYIVIVAASVYDIRLKMHKKAIDKVQAKLRGSRQPFVTILVYAQNSAENIEKCLDSICRSRYSRYDVVVIDDSSSDGTRGKVRLYKQKYPLFPVKLYSKRRRGDRLETFRQGYRRSQRGDLLLVIDALSTINPTLLKSGAARFVFDDKLNVLHLNVYNTSSNSITLLYYRFVQLSGSLFKKFLSLISKYQVETLEGGSIYRRCIFREACTEPSMIGRYDSNLVVADYSVNSDKDVISYLVAEQNKAQYKITDVVRGSLFFIIAILAIILQTYSMYIAATLQSRVLLIIGWLAVALWLLIATWSAETTNIFDKIKLTFCVPIIYFLLYARTIIYVISKIITAISSLARSAFGLVNGAIP